MATTAPSPGPQLSFVSPAMPPELILKIVQYLPFDSGRDILRLRYVHPRLRDVLRIYERSLTRAFMNRELPHASTDFPCCARFGYRCLAECVKRYDIVDDVMDALSSRQNCYAVDGHNIALLNAGLLLVYRVSSIGNHSDKLTFIKSLSRDPLTAMYLVLHHATLTARYHGSGWIHQRTYGRFMDANQISLRNELEFCFAEAALTLGPEFISDLLLRPAKSGAEATFLNFYLDHGTHDWDWPGWGEGDGEFNPPRTQGPKKQPGSMGRTLFTTLLERLAECSNTTVDEVRGRIEDQTTDPDHPLSHLNLHGKARLMQGRNWDWAEEEQQKGRRDSLHS
ncbi:hypothetical protein C7974DRAFT_59447 [Boeremia exigua]|uniref:uncharacterized protein n=1 Tax=Boeremia exigua TaxID=749465 RepID=UPI001E8EF0CD|nr:uncharacterized protein C7974DRAFT_59447 [Boeremia exigua]KAH6615108.1 hypothetical protein C7974DRAFT_59447 [Boeremia exigua]